jgi:DNA polymerase-3 subunit alpha
LARATAWPEAEALAKEKEVLGFYVSSHPLDRWKFWSSVFATAHTQSIKDQLQDARVVIAAMVQSARTLLVKNGRSAGQKMAILTVEDMHGACDCVMFTDCYRTYGHLATSEAVVFVMGRVDLSRGDPQIIVDRLVPVDGVPLESGRLRLFLDATKVNGDGPRVVSRVAELLKASPGGPAPAAATGKKHADTAQSLFPVDVVIATDDTVALLAADPKIRVALEPELVKGLQAELGVGMMRVVGGLTFDKEKEKKPWHKRRGDNEE